MLTPLSRLLIVAAALLCGALAYRFFRKQNREGTPGGRISRPKIAWLFYAIFVWFLLSAIVALDPNVPTPVRYVVGSFAISMWLRGLVELFMLYVTHNWRPPYGIGHDVLCLLLIGGVTVSQREALSGAWPVVAYWGFVGIVAVSLVVEVAYAALFFRVVKGATTGKQGVWFADDDPRFDHINRITTACNTPLFLATLAFLGFCLFA